jgi:hypothetical protein
MDYTKPEVAVLGNADRLIGGATIPKPGNFSDGHNSPNTVTPAYDLDE